MNQYRINVKGFYPPDHEKHPAGVLRRLDAEGLDPDDACTSAELQLESKGFYLVEAMSWELA